MRVPMMILAPIITLASVAPADARQRSVINLSGLEYNGHKLDAQIFRDYVPPSDATLKAAKRAGFWGVRLPISMERLQPDPAKAKAGELAETYVSQIVDATKRGQAAGLKVIVDLHNFGQYWGNDIDRTSSEASQNIRPMYLGIVRAFAGRLQKAGVWGFELGNEPKNLDPARCQSVMQDAVVAARKAGFSGTLFVPSAWWSNAQNGVNCIVKDPLNKWVQDVHAYGDKDGSGTYKQAFAQEGVTHDTIVDRVRPAVQQAKAKKIKLFVGEVGAPLGDADRRKQVAQLAKYLAANNVDWAYWTAGEWTGNDRNSLQSGLAAGDVSAAMSALPPQR